MHCAPLSDYNDGQNDIIIQSSKQSRGQLYKLLNRLEDGQLFRGNEQKLNPEYGAEYIKCDSWELKPLVKGPIPENLKFQRQEAA